MMDIHRCRFVPYPPQTINALAFSHSSNPTKKAPTSLRLALGRVGGDVEIWNPQNGSWFQEKILRGGKDRTIEGLAWTQDSLEDNQINQDGPLRLFSIGDSPSVTEWNLTTGTPKRHVDGNFGDFWCLAAQPPREPTNAETPQASSIARSQFLAAGCGDGTIVLFTTEDQDLRFFRSLGKTSSNKQMKVLSITWSDRNTIVAGYDDSSIRIHDIRSKNILQTMSLGRSGDGNECYVWALKCLKDGTILSGDSSGELKIWDAKNHTLVQRLKTHDADILDIGASSGGDIIITVGVDRRTVAYAPTAKNIGSKQQRWTQIMHRRFHQHDIKSIATFESKELSVMVSGGVDTVPILAPLRRWQDEYHRTLTNLPQAPQLCSAPEARLVVGWWGREILIWFINERETPNEIVGHPLPSSDNDYETVTRILLKDEENITSAHISSTGDLVAVSTAANVKLFQLRMSFKNGTRALRTRPIDLPRTVGMTGAKLVRFSPDSCWLCIVRLNNDLQVSKISQEQSAKSKPAVSEKAVRLTRKPRGTTSQLLENPLGDYLKSITSLEFSSDSRILASGDISGSVDTWILEDLTSHPRSTQSSADDSSDSDSEDEGGDKTTIHGQRWIRTPSGSDLPQLNSAILGLVFRSQQKSIDLHPTTASVQLHPMRRSSNSETRDVPREDAWLIAVTANHQIIEFDVFGCKLSNWSRRNPASYLPHCLQTIKDRAVACFWDGKNEQARLWVYGPSWLFMLDMSQDLPAPEAIGRLGNYDVLEPLTNSQNKRKRLRKQQASRKQRNTGAGDEIHIHETYTGIGRYALKFKENKQSDGQVVKMTEAANPISDDEMNDTLHDSTLTAMRRNADDDEKSQELSGPIVQIDTEEGNGHRPGWMLSLNYRSIFGIVPIVGVPTGSELSAKGRRNPEVVVVERPIYDLDFPPRFDGGQDWET